MISFVIQHSWQYFIYYRCQNVNRKSRNDEIQPRKKPKFDDKLPAHVCPPIHAEDEVSFGRHLEVLNTERQKPKPRLEVLKDMMRRTFPNRWDLYINHSTPPTLFEYLAEYPLLKKTLYVSYMHS